MQQTEDTFVDDDAGVWKNPARLIRKLPRSLAISFVTLSE
jgi:hypothetical protein